jgi:hypothetical protein
METQGYTFDVEWFCSTQTLLKDHVLNWWMMQKQVRPNLFTMLT